MSTGSVTPSSVTAYYGVGFLGIFSIASYFSITKFWDRFKHRQRPTDVNQRQRQIDALREELERKQTAMQDLRGQLAVLEDTTREKEKTWVDVREEMERTGRVSRAELDETRERNASLSESLRKYARELELEREETRRLRSLNEELQASVAMMQGFPTKAKSVANTDVIRMVTVLNGEICKTARLVTEFYETEASQQADRVENEEEVVEGAMEYTKEILGEKMTDMLGYYNHGEDTVLLHFGLQASMCAYTEWITTSWVYRDRDDEQLIQEIYDRLREKEESPISSRWRILTRKYVRQVFRGTQQQINLSDYFFDAFTNVLVTAGLRVNGSLDALSERLKDKFASHVAEIINHAIQLNNAIGEDITSCELVPINCETGIPFDDDSMENTFRTASENTFIEENILCTAELGLLRSEKVRGREGDWTHQILLKPKVLLQSVVETASPLSENSSQQID
ncbi:hypothetical protein AAF712_008979 [Marasmius tenuissimus]|uniref:Uncharacterized protein n=1 Tax=Marasmius tenuissimus TaxID=585030 RepID=A0ABR2ZTE6_9AGAR